jgi:hypothetical protein
MFVEFEKISYPKMVTIAVRDTPENRAVQRKWAVQL